MEKSVDMRMDKKKINFHSFTSQTYTVSPNGVSLK